MPIAAFKAELVRGASCDERTFGTGAVRNLTKSHDAVDGKQLFNTIK